LQFATKSANIIDETKQKTHKSRSGLRTCLLPLTPRCGLAKVIKFTGSSPAIKPCLVKELVLEASPNSPLHKPLIVYKTETAYRANNPPRE